MLYKILKIIATPIFFLFFRIRVHGEHRLPDRRMIVCSNHISLLDPILLAVVFDRRIHFMAKKELYRYGILRWLLPRLGVFPVDRGKSDIQSIKTSIRLLKEEKVLGIFPEGTRVKTIDIANVKPGVGLLAARTSSDIQPVRIDTNYKLFHRTDVFIQEPIRTASYDLKDKDINHRLAHDVYRSIYEVQGELHES
ncbi:MAG: lysophospholipid acyltransferase family protein [Tissierellia bacterium]|nr:lysophospholipid acyltransferase family protein [Tissierellia bacterium]